MTRFIHRHRVLAGGAPAVEPLPDGARYVGTQALAPEGFVWHLYELAGG